MALIVPIENGKSVALIVPIKNGKSVALIVPIENVLTNVTVSIFYNQS